MDGKVTLLYRSLKFSDALSRFALADAMRHAGTVILAYSGGADSTCLLHHLHDWCGKNGVVLAAAHVNHRIRGEDADRDEDFCRATCGKLQIPLFVLRKDVPTLAKETGRGLEETARAVRYAFFDEVSAKLTGSPDKAVIATAHNADDHLETVLFHLLRGSGTRGLAGIDPLRDGRYVRPLLLDSGGDIRAWCANCGIPYVTDATNADTDYTRNFLRHNVVPGLEQICDDPRRAVLRMAALLRQDNDYFDQLVRETVPEGSASLGRASLNRLHPAVASRVVLALYGNCDGHTSLEETHVREILAKSAADGTEYALSLPGSVQCRIDRHTVRFAKTEEASAKEDGNILFTYPNDGDLFENARYIIRFSHEGHTNNVQNDENIYKLVIRRTFCFDKIRSVLHIRTRRPGDTYRFGGMTRKVKKLFIDRKLTSEEKAALPLLCDGEGILWIPGFPPRDGTAAEHGLTVTVYQK